MWNQHLPRRRVLALVLAAPLGGCGMAQVESQPIESGETRSFNAPFSSVRQAAREAIVGVGFEFTQSRDEPDREIINFIRPMSGNQYGAVGRMAIDRHPPEGPIAVHVSYLQR